MAALARQRAAARASQPARDEARLDTGSGTPLDASTRRRFETPLGADLSGVRIHDNEAAHHTARLARANAVTEGEDIAFARGRFDPGSARGQRLLAHELTHVVQHRLAPAAPTRRWSDPSDAFEREADHVADALVRGRALPAITHATAGARARDDTDFDPDDDDVDTSIVEDDELGPAEVEFSFSVSSRDPSVVFVPATMTREEIAREFGVTMDTIYPVGASEVPRPSSDQVGIRFFAPSNIPANVAEQMRARFDALLPVDVEATLDALADETGRWTAAQYVLRWSQYSRYTDSSGHSYFDRFLDALSSRTITTTTNYVVTSTTSSRNGLDELLAETSGDVNAAVRRARARSSRGTVWDAALNEAQPFSPGHVVGRWISGRDTAAVAAHVMHQLGVSSSRESAEIEFRNSSYLGPKIAVLDSSGWWYGYGLYFDTRASGSLFPPVVGSSTEDGRFYWYYPHTLYFGPGEQDPLGPTDQAANTLTQRRVLLTALSNPQTSALVALDAGVLSRATPHERITIFRRILDAGFDSSLNGYSTRDAADAMARIVMAMPPEEFRGFERTLDEEGLTARLLTMRDARLASLGAAFTYQTIASSPLGPAAFSDPTVLTQGTERISHGLNYYLATPHVARSHVVARSDWDPNTTVSAAGGTPVEQGLAGEATHDISRTTVSFEYGHSPTDWGDTPPWNRRSSTTTRQFLPTELLMIESVNAGGRQRRVASAFEAALTQGDPESQVDHESLMGFLEVVMMVHGGLGIARLGSIGLRAFAAGSIRAAMRVLARELTAQTGRAALRSVVDLALFNAVRYAEQHHEELERTPEGRAFLAAVTAATVVLATRDIVHLVESGAIQRVVALGRGALRGLSDAAQLAVRRTMRNFRAAGRAWRTLEAEGLVLQTNVGGLVVRRPSSIADLNNAFRRAQAEVAREDLITTLGPGSPAASRAESTLANLEREAGGFGARAPGQAPATPGELGVARSARDAARHAANITDDAQRARFFDAIDQLMGTPSRSVEDLAPFITGATRAAGRGMDPVAYLEAAQALAARRGLTQTSLRNLANNALGRRPVDLVWLNNTSLSTRDLDFLARDPKTPWADFINAANNPSRTTMPRAMRGARAAGAEMVAGEQAGTLVPGFRVNRRQVTMGGRSELDFELISTDRLGRRRPMEVKGWTRQTWERSIDAWRRRGTGEVLTESADIAGANQVRKMLRQLDDAAAGATRGELPILAISSDLQNTPAVRRLQAILQSEGVSAEIVFLPEAQITATGARLGRGLGFR